MQYYDSSYSLLNHKTIEISTHQLMLIKNINYKVITTSCPMDSGYTSNNHRLCRQAPTWGSNNHNSYKIYYCRNKIKTAYTIQKTQYHCLLYSLSVIRIAIKAKVLIVFLQFYDAHLGSFWGHQALNASVSQVQWLYSQLMSSATPSQKRHPLHSHT